MRHINFGITGREFQETFNVEKYTALAYQQPRGLLLQELVELNWAEWCRTVAEAPWITYWKKSQYWKQPCVTPADLHCSVMGCGNVPIAIYSCAVWGFGVEEWLKKTGRGMRAPMHDILRLQGVKDPRVSLQRAHMWDAKLLRGCGMQMPSEFGELDRWLEPLWQQVCRNSSSK